MANVSDTGAAVNSDFDVMDDYQRTAADLTDAFSNTAYDDTKVEIPISEISTDPEVAAYLRSYDTDKDGSISRDEYNRAMTDLTDKTNTLTSVSLMLSDTVAKISEALMAVSKFF
ncbi:MAG: hypothetical protein AABZ57_08715 [Candidatus Margulisiibacteriota bacterium]